MPYEVRKDKDKFCVVNKDTNESKGCSDSREQAVSHLKALYAVESKMAAEEAISLLEDEDEPTFGDSYEFSDAMKEHLWRGPIVFEGIYTGDNRIFKANSITWQEDTLPWPLRWQKHSGQGHAGSVPVGRVDRLERKEDGSIEGFGVVIPELNDEADQYYKLLKSGAGGGVSVDGDSAQFEIQEEEGSQPKVEFSSMRLRALSAVDVPAFNGARIHLIEDEPKMGEETVTAEVDGSEALEIDVTEALEPRVSESEVIVSDLREELAKKKRKKKAMSYGWSIDEALTAAGIPVLPSTEAFVDPEFTGPTALTVTPDGKVFGHLALFNTCHIGFPGTCVKPPKGSKYQYFHTGQIETVEGDLVDCGRLTFKTGHADMHATPRIAADHYDNTGTVAADVRAGEDKFGIWVVGALRPHLTDEDIRAFRAAPLSGDWRRIAGKLELVGALGVNTPGFPVPRIRALVASGETETLITFLEDTDVEFIVSDYEMNLRLDRKIDLAAKLSDFLKDDVSETVPDGPVKEEVPDPPTKKELEERAANYTKNQLFADLKAVRELLDDPDEKMSAKVRKGLEELYDAAIKVDGSGNKLTYNGFDLDIIDGSGLEIEEWEAELELSGLAVEEFYNQCHGEDGKFCPGTDGPGRIRDNVKGRHYIENARPGTPEHGSDVPGESPEAHAAKAREAGGHNRGNQPGNKSGQGGQGQGQGGQGGYQGQGGGVDNKAYENFRITRKRATGWAAAATLALAVSQSPAAGILQGIATAGGLALLGNPAVLTLITVTGVAYATKNIMAARKHRADFNRQVDRKIARDKLYERRKREDARLRVST